MGRLSNKMCKMSIVTCSHIWVSMSQLRTPSGDTDDSFILCIICFNTYHFQYFMGSLSEIKYIKLTSWSGLTHWGRVTPIYVSKLTMIRSDNGRRQAIIWTNARILLIWNLGTNFSEILREIHKSSLKKIHLKMSSAICVNSTLFLYSCFQAWWKYT